MSRLVDHFRKQKVFSIEEAQAAFNSKGENLTRLLHYLVQNGKVKRIRRGLYCVIDDETTSPNPYTIAARITQPYYLAYHTALELHGVAYSAFRNVFVASEKTFAAFAFHGVQYLRILPLNADIKTGNEEMRIENLPVRTSDRERTIIDCLDRINYAGGVEECLKSLMNFPMVDPEKTLSYLAIFNRKILHAKVGWLFEQMQSEWQINEAVLQKLEKPISKRPMPFDQVSREVKHYRRWNLLIPRNIEALLQGV